jgi:hypothetical protein
LFRSLSGFLPKFNQRAPRRRRRRLSIKKGLFSRVFLFFFSITAKEAFIVHKHIKGYRHRRRKFPEKPITRPLLTLTP